MPLAGIEHLKFLFSEILASETSKYEPVCILPIIYMPLAGIEPATHSLGNCCSILMSYRGSIFIKVLTLRGILSKIEADILLAFFCRLSPVIQLQRQFP